MDEGFEILAAEEPDFEPSITNNPYNEEGQIFQARNPSDLLANLLSGVLGEGLQQKEGSSLIAEDDTGPAMCFAMLLSRARMEMELAADVQRTDVQRSSKEVTCSSIEALLHYGNSGRLFAQAGKVGEKLEVDGLILEAVRRLEITCRGNVEGLQRLIDHDELLAVVEERKQKRREGWKRYHQMQGRVEGVESQEQRECRRRKLRRTMPEPLTPPRPPRHTRAILCSLRPD